MRPHPVRRLFVPLALAAAGLTFAVVFLAASRPARSADEPPAPPRLVLRTGDHVSFLGNTLADRMQHDGWLETLLLSRFPRHQLTIRNLGFSGDEVEERLRLRSAGFGSPDEWLARNSTDVVFAFFGYNESFAGRAGLGKFKKDLASFITHTRSKRYNGKAPPQVVIFSPIAHEDLHSPNLPDGKANNARLALYTDAMADVCRAAKVVFVDLFRPTRALYATAKKPLTINGVHLNEEGNRQVALVIDEALFPGQKPGGKRDARSLAALRAAVKQKNFYWFQRYRTTDGYSVFGGRSYLRFTDGQTNREVAQREMQVLDVMTANRDQLAWSVAQGKTPEVSDDNTPPFIPVKTNKPGKGPGGSHIYLDPEKAIGKMTVGKGMKVNLFASEKDFPELVNPVQMSWDPQGRLWVAVWPTYPHWQPKTPMNDKILVLEDTKGTGKADKCTVWADGLHCPTGFEFWNGGVLVAQAPDLLFLKDSKGAGKADTRTRVLSGLDSADTHHTSNSFVLGPGGGLYFQEGTFHRTQVETPWGPAVRCADAGVYRYEPRTQKFAAYVSYGFANPHGHVFDRWGQDVVIDGTGSTPYHAALFSGHLAYPNKHAHPPELYNVKGIRPCPGIEILSSRHFPPDFQGDLLVANVIGFHGIRRVKLKDDGASFTGSDEPPILSSSDENFRPSDLKVGPDGALYVLDWQNPIIGHMQHNLRDPSRGKTHGRIYRVSYPSRPLLKPATIAGQGVDKLLALLKEPEDRVRYRARLELTKHPASEVIPAVKKWVAALPKDGDYEHNLLEALWQHQSQNVVDAPLLEKVLAASDFRARAAATRVLSYWHDRIPGALDLLCKLAADDHPRVRLEAIRAASFFDTPEAVEVIPIAATKPTDRYIDFVKGETLRALQPALSKAIAAGHKLKMRTPAGMRYLLRNVTTGELMRMERSAGVYEELLFRPGVRDEFRREALKGLATLKKRSELAMLLDAVRAHDAEEGAADEGLAFDLVRLLTARPAAELREARADIEKLAATAKQPVTRQLGFVTLIAADGGVEKAWALASKSVRGLQDLVSAMPLVRDPAHRTALYPRVAALLGGLPRELAPKGGSDKAVLGRYVRVELPGRRKTLTLAEVEVYSDGVNVARRGKASQKNTAYGGDAGRAIDGNTSGTYGGGGQTHTQENTASPWWEVDLGAEFPIERVVVYNRTDGGLGSRLQGFTLQVLDQARGVVWQKRRIPAPQRSTAFALGGSSPERVVRRAAMQALPSVRGQEVETVKLLAKFVKDDADRHVAVLALQRVPGRLWPADQARPVLDELVGYVRKVPERDRTAAPVVDALQLADTLTGLLPVAEARKTRKELGELGVRVVRIGTVLEQMIYDKERIVVQAGKTVEIVFENLDTMPHNLVFVRPGALEEVGNLAEATGTSPQAPARQYVPASDKVIVASRLVQPRQAERLSFKAPGKPGVYPYVCTYPGHWRRMHGALYVVADLEKYLENPEGYLAKSPLPVADELLKFNRPRKEWKLADLAPSAVALSGRSFASGKQMFSVGACVSCHKLGGVGQEFGPDLTKLDPKWKPADVLQHILEPSLKIDDKYRSWTLELASGKQVTGMILGETKTLVKLIENPLAATKPLEIKAANITSRTKSPTSPMPKGLLDKMTREEILDLLAYVVSGANPKHPAFHGAGHDHHKH